MNFQEAHPGGHLPHAKPQTVRCVFIFLNSLPPPLLFVWYLDYPYILLYSYVILVISRVLWVGAPCAVGHQAGGGQLQRADRGEKRWDRGPQQADRERWQGGCPGDADGLKTSNLCFSWINYLRYIKTTVLYYFTGTSSSYKLYSHVYSALLVFYIWLLEKQKILWTRKTIIKTNVGRGALLAACCSSCMFIVHSS